MKGEVENLFEKAMEKHLPVAFINYGFLEQVKALLYRRDEFGRKELLIMAYVIGASIEETNEILCAFSYPKLYAKRREDAIWIYALNHHYDCKSILEETFRQNMDD